MKVIFKVSNAAIEAELNDSKNAAKIYNGLPIEAKANSIEGEIYFEIPVKCQPEDDTLDVEIGDIAYWPEGACLCIFSGKTSASTGTKPMPAFKVNVIGKISGDPAILKSVRSGDKIKVERGYTKK